VWPPARRRSEPCISATNQPPSHVSGLSTSSPAGNVISSIAFQRGRAGASYTINTFSKVGGAPNLVTHYESRSYRLATRRRSRSVPSDEWEDQLMAESPARKAGDNADPDGDGAPNWIEDLQGPDPTNANTTSRWTQASCIARSPAMGSRSGGSERQAKHMWWKLPPTIPGLERPFPA